MKFPDGVPVYGDQSYRDKSCPKEDAELITFFNQLRLRSPALAAVALHIKNEGQRTGQQAMAERAKGALKTGATDIVITAAGSFICELKRKDHTLSRLEGAQEKQLKAGLEVGAFACIALGYEAAFEALEAWIETMPAKVRARIGYTGELI